MIHKAYMPVYMNSGKIVADGTGRVDGDSKVLQEVLADLKKKKSSRYNLQHDGHISLAPAVIV